MARESTAAAKNNNSDRISDLPQPILHGILSSLTTKDVTKTSVLSKLFLSTWRSFPVIDLDGNLSHSASQVSLDVADRIQLAEDFFQSVRRTIEQRHGLDADLQSLRLSVPVSKEKLYLDHVRELISFGLTKQVRNLEIDLDGFGDKYILSLIESLPGPFNSVQTMTLSNLRLKSSEDLMSFPALKDLFMKKCSMFDDFKLSSSNIRSIELTNCADLKSIMIKGPSLLKFGYEAAKKSTGEVNHCEIDISDCKFLQILSISNVSSNWLEENVANLFYLEKLIISQCLQMANLAIRNKTLKAVELVGCPTVKSIDICSRILPSLETLCVDSCRALKDIIVDHCGLYSFKLTHCEALKWLYVDTPRLVSFVYKGPACGSSLFNSRASLDAKLSVYSTRWTSAKTYFSKLRDFVGHFNHGRVLTLACSSSQDLIFPHEVRWECGRLLCDLKHLRVYCEGWSQISTDLVDSLIWLSPHLDTLSFVSNNGNEKSLKFQYDSVIGGEKEDQMCCYEKIVKCWRHSLKMVEMTNFNLVDAENLENYFRMNAKFPISIGK